MMAVHTLQGKRQSVQCFGVVIMRIQIFANRNIGTGNLIHIIILLEFLQSQLS